MLEKLITYIAKKFGSKVIIRDRKTQTPYLVRYVLVSTKYFSIYVHRFLISDKGWHHDHPWNFLTWVITKGYKEERLVQGKTSPVDGYYIEKIVTRKPGTIALRRAEDLHLVKIDRVYSPEEEHLAPLTVCIIGKNRRVWGFAARNLNDTLVWQNWADYLELDEAEIKEQIETKAAV